MRLASFVRIGVTSAIAAVIAWRVPVQTLGTALAQIEPIWLLPALGAILAMLLVRWARWHALLGAGGVESSRTASAGSLLGGFALGAVMPGRLGEMGRFLFVPAGDRARVILLNLIDRTLDTWALGTFAVGSLFLIAPRPAALVAVCVWMCLLPFIVGLPRIVSKLGGLPWWSDGLRAKLRTAAETLPNLRVGGYAGVSLLSTGCDLLAFFFLLRAFQDVRLGVVLATFPWIVMAAGLPVSVGGLGTREGASAILLSRFAIPASVALDASLLLCAFGSLLPALIGTAWHALSHNHGALRRANRLREAMREYGPPMEVRRCLQPEPRLDA
jgi:uncharacterized membrane protein YbhN (UPF0104 family)